MKTNLFLAGVVSVLLIVFVPFCLVWSVNTLFSQHNPYNLTTWAAGAAIITLLRMPNFKE